MKKILVLGVVAIMLMSAVVSTSPAASGSGRGGVMGFFAGCCFGIRAGAAYNDGKEIHWREWIALIIPIIPSVWNGIDGANGMTSSDYAEQYGTAFY